MHSIERWNCEGFAKTVDFEFNWSIKEDKVKRPTKDFIDFWKEECLNTKQCHKRVTEQNFPAWHIVRR